jgi:hypothetical protein
MLTAAYLRALARTVPAARTLGLVGAAAGLWSRARRHADLWASHEAACHALVRTAMANLPNRRTALVLGSGLCRDIPLDELAGAFAQVLLIDAVHLPTIRARARRWPNVGLEARDITGLADWLTGRANAPLDALADLRARPDIDLVISANVLSQLPFALEDWIAAHPDPALPADLPTHAIRRHLADLGRFGGRVCLLTDVRAAGRGETIDLLRGETLPPPDRTWSWPVQPDVIHTVHGYANLAAAGRFG